MTPATSIVLGSRSPRRRELLSLLASGGQVRVVPPLVAEEPGFEGRDSLEEILRQLAAIASGKNDDVRAQLSAEDAAIIVTADTVVIARDASGNYQPLGQPDGQDWEARVRRWFTEYYLGRSHLVATAVCVTAANGPRDEFDCVSEVEFSHAAPDLVDWYVGTKEPLGKAGGYGLQGAGGVFVSAVRGSVSNVVGLPLRETWEALRRMGCEL